MKKSFLTSPALALGLAFSAPVFFVFSRNSHMVTLHSLLIASGIVFLLACLIVAIASVALRFWNKLSVNLPKWLQRLVVIGFCLLLVETSCFFLQEQLHALVPDPRWLRILISRIAPFLLLLALVRKCGFSPVNVFLSVFLGISVLTLGAALTEGTTRPNFITPLQEGSLGSDSSQATYELKKRPNIYLFFLESYHSLDVQRDVYGIETKELEAWLAKNDFVDYGKVYSNSFTTLLSYADTFGFSSSRAFARGNDDAARSIRSMLQGNKHNTLFRTLKANGYTTVFLVAGSSHYGSARGEFLDDSDGLVRSPRDALILEVIRCVEMLNSRFREDSVLVIRKYYTNYSGSLQNRVFQAVKTHMRPGSPLFLAFKGGASHTRADGSYTWQQHANWVQSGFYQGRIQTGNQQLRQICDGLIAQDPGALIILIGDHGPRRFRGAEDGPALSSLDELIARVQAKGISLQDFCDDRYAVFLAVRLPHGQREDLSHGQPMSHVNLFRHVFAYLNDDTTILTTRVPSNSYLQDLAIIREGRVAAEP